MVSSCDRGRKGSRGSSVAVRFVLEVEERGGSNISGSRIGICISLFTTLKDVLEMFIGQLSAACYVWQVEHCLVNRLYTWWVPCPEAGVVLVVVEGG